MSASSLPLPFVVPNSSAFNNREIPTAPRKRPNPARILRRKPNMQQGRALEMLGHAIEYLVDSRMFLVAEPRVSGDDQAIQILACASREVFATCAIVVPVTQRLKHWAAHRLGITTLDPIDGLPHTSSPRV